MLLITIYTADKLLFNLLLHCCPILDFHLTTPCTSIIWFVKETLLK